MGKLERLAAARERVKAWKAKHPKSVAWQQARAYARRRAKKIGALKAKVGEKGGVKVRVVLPGERLGELHYGPVEGYDTREGEN